MKTESWSRLLASTVFQYFLSVLLVAISLLLTYFLQPFLFQTSLFFLSIMIATWIGGIGPGLTAAFLSTAAIVLILNPAGILAFSYRDLPSIIGIFIAALLVGSWSASRRRAEQALQQAHDELESRVHERTAELNQTNQELQAEIAERMQAEETILRYSKRAQLLADISQRLAEAGLDYRRVLDTIAQQIADMIGDQCDIFQISEDERRAIPVAFYHTKPQARTMLNEFFKTWSGKVNSEPFKTILSGGVIFIPVVDPEAIRAATTPELWPYLDQVGISSALAVPLRAQNQVIGLLAITRDKPGHPYEPEVQVLLQQIADRAALTIENARLYQSVCEQRERLRALNLRLIEAREAERRRIARELHDEIGQLLTGLEISMKIASRASPEEIQTCLADSQKLVKQLLDQVQSLSLDLRPSVLDDLGLVPAISMQIERYTHQTGIQVRFDHHGVNHRFPATIETAAYRIVQEGLTNLARHAHTQASAVRIWAKESMLGLQIEDAGIGFDVPAALASRTSSGLSGMQEEAELLGGQLTIESAPGSGTLITVELPLGGGEKEGQDERDDNCAGG